MWVTNGTAVGTQQLSVMTKNGLAYPAGNDITAFGNQALFVGTDANGNNSIWVTDGTILGTQELITIGTNYSNYTNDITAFGNQAIFYAVDASGFGELWATDGTKTGTKELTSVGSNFHNGLQPYDITVFGNQFLFNGYDTNGNNALWEMSDTNAGPQELQNVPGSDTANFYPSNMTALSTDSNPLPTGKWLAPLNGFSIQQGNSIPLSVEADPGSSGSPITSVSISTTWGKNNAVVCHLTQPDTGTSDEYSCIWNFQYQGQYINGGPVTFDATIIDQAGNKVDDPDGARTGTFVQHVTVPTHNWGGYGAYSPDGSQLYSDVVGSWTVPAVTQCASEKTSTSSAWVGLGGNGQNETDPLEQIGTDTGCKNGKPLYRAWYEMVPSDPVFFVDIKPGDSIDATVEYVGNSQYTLSMSINGTVYSYTLARQNTILAQNAAECIQEDPLTDPLADFGTITFDHCYLVQTGLSGTQTKLPINSGPALVAYTLTSQDQSHLLETVGPLNSTTSNSSFTVTWNATR